MEGGVIQDGNSAREFLLKREAVQLKTEILNWVKQRTGLEMGLEYEVMAFLEHRHSHKDFLFVVKSQSAGIECISKDKDGVWQMIRLAQKRSPFLGLDVVNLPVVKSVRDIDNSSMTFDYENDHDGEVRGDWKLTMPNWVDGVSASEQLRFYRKLVKKLEKVDKHREKPRNIVRSLVSHFKRH